jgi:predicted protein tyrosine phosphatase
MQQHEKTAAGDRDGVAIGDREGSIHVCPLSAVPTVVTRHNASHLLTCLQDAVLVETPPGIVSGRHLRLHIHDIAEPMLGCIEPGEEHVTQLIDFARGWGGRGPMVVHCWAGISRSTAAAYAALCAINPGVPEELIAMRLREASPTAYPNRLIVRLADDALRRGGRMVRAVEAIGRGVIATEAVPFSLPADHSDAAKQTW